MDDFELEVTDLDAAASQGASDPLVGDEAEAPAALPNAALGFAAMPDGGLPTAGRSRPILRRRLLASATVSACLLVALALIVSVSPAEPAVIGRLFPTPTPLPIGAGTLIFEHYAPWGLLTMSGQAALVGQLSQPLGSSLIVPKLVLSPGRHVLDYRAAPFPPLRCQISAPAARSDTCPLLHPAANDPVQGFGATRILDLRAEPDRLPPDQRAALLAAVQAELLPPDEAVVLPGEAYMAADGTVAVAHEQLTATFLETLNQEPASAIQTDTGLCVTLCVQPIDHPDLKSWLVSANVALGWRYATPDERVLIPYAPAVPPASGISSDVAIDLEVHWTGEWQMTLLNPQELNPPGVNPLNPLCSILAIDSGMPVDTFPAPSPAQGCAARAVGYFPVFFFQFGVVLAASNDTHRLYPSLPVADARQQTLAQQLIAQAGGA
jgi:hypothetical protein